MKKVIFIIFILVSGCKQIEMLYIPIVNHTDSILYLSVKIDENIVIKDLKIDILSLTTINKKIFILDDKSTKHLNFNFQLKDNINSNPIYEDTLWFPGGGIFSNSSKGGFFVAIDIFSKDNEINVLFSNDTFIYGLPSVSSLNKK